MNLYLSRLLLNPRARQVMSEMAHPYEMHRTLMRAFPQAADPAQSQARDEFGVLFRADVDEPLGPVKVYVQSRVQPDWSCLEGLDGYLCATAGTPPCDCKDIMPASHKIHQGQVLSFRLRANPTKRIARDGDPLKGKRVELQREEEQLDWLMRKGQAAGAAVPGGFELLMKQVRDEGGQVQPVPAVKVWCEGKQTARKKDTGGGRVATHLAVRFEGLLRVTDADAFRETLVRGIGSAKAFGFGLLSLAPANI